jgi:hypothetical protein
MKTIWKWRALSTTGLGLALATLTGCQTWVAGMTLPSGHYLEHQPQYFAPSPPFPLSRELAQQQEAAAGARPGAAVPPGAPPIPAVPPPVPLPPAPVAPAPAPAPEK